MEVNETLGHPLCSTEIGGKTPTDVNKTIGWPPYPSLMASFQLLTPPISLSAHFNF